MGGVWLYWHVLSRTRLNEFINVKAWKTPHKFQQTFAQGVIIATITGLMSLELAVGLCVLELVHVCFLGL